VSKLRSNHRVGKEVVHSTMAKIWRVYSLFTFQEINTNMFVITFTCHEDKR
jgi:hypothetical protein